MSIDAMRWAWEKKLRPSVKLVLLSMADRASENHECWPSIARLEIDTCLDRKTIMTAIVSLEQEGLISVSRVLGEGNKYKLIGVEGRDSTSTKNGTSPKTGTSPKNGTTQYQKRDTHQYQKRDTNLSIEPINNPKTYSCKEKGEKINSDTQIDSLGERVNKPEKRIKQIKTCIADDFSITGNVLDWYAKNGYQEDINLHYSSFVDKCQANGYAYVNWDSAFKNAIRGDWAGLRKNKSPNVRLNNNPGFIQHAHFTPKTAHNIVVSQDWLTRGD